MLHCLCPPLLLQDPVFCVRQAATDCLAALAKEFGPDWAREHVVPRVLGLVGHSNYLYRITVLGAVAALAPVVPRDTLCSAMLPVVVSCAKVGCAQGCWPPALCCRDAGAGAAAESGLHAALKNTNNIVVVAAADILVHPLTE